MSALVTQDEDWSIISSSSDFEDESVSEISVRDDSGNSTPSESASINNDIDESTGTIRGSGGVKDKNGSAVESQVDENETFVGESAEALDVAEDVSPDSGLQPCAIITGIKASEAQGGHDDHDACHDQIAAACKRNLSKCGECAVAKAAQLVFAFTYVDHYLRSLSRTLFGFLWGRRLRTLKSDVAAGGTACIPLYKHAVFLVLSTLERNQDLLLYYLAALGGVTALVAHYAYYPVPESTMSSKFQQLWVDMVYEPEQTGFGRFFHASKPKQLKAARYMSVALALTGQMFNSLNQHLQAQSNWVKSTWSESPWILSKMDWARSVQKAGADKLASISSEDVRSWFTNAVGQGDRIIGNALAKREPLQQALHQRWEEVSKWLDSILDAATEAYHDVLVPSTAVASSHVARWFGTAKVVSANCASSTWKQTKVTSQEVQEQLIPLAHSLLDQSKILLERAKAESTVAAVEANKVVEKLSKASVCYGQKAWSNARGAVKAWYDSIDC